MPEGDDIQPTRQPRHIRNPYTFPLDLGYGNAPLGGGVGPAITPAPDRFALDDEAPVYDWYIPTKKTKTIPNAKTIKISIRCKEAIEDIAKYVLLKQLFSIKNIYAERIDLIDSNNIDALYASFDEGDSRELYVFRSMHNSFEALISECELSSREDKVFLNAVEERAKELYHIDYSKYRFYPRLKSTVKYGEAELLAEILIVTQLDKGKVLWK